MRRRRLWPLVLLAVAVVLVVLLLEGCPCDWIGLGAHGLPQTDSCREWR